MVVKSRVRAVITYQAKLLLVQHQGYNTWCLPGGGIEAGEGLKDALKRELFEELGVHADIGKLLVVHQFKEDGYYQGPEFFFEVTNPHDFVQLDIRNTSHGQAEIAKAEFKDPSQTENIRPSFLNQLLHQQDMLVVLE